MISQKYVLLFQNLILQYLKKTIVDHCKIWKFRKREFTWKVVKYNTTKKSYENFNLKKKLIKKNDKDFQFWIYVYI